MCDHINGRDLGYKYGCCPRSLGTNLSTHVSLSGRSLVCQRAGAPVGISLTLAQPCPRMLVCQLFPNVLCGFTLINELSK